MDTIGYVLLALMFSTFFSGMAVAFASMDKVRFEIAGKSSSWDARIITLLLRHAGSFRSSMLVGSHISLVVYGLGVACLVVEAWPAEAAFNAWGVVITQIVIAAAVILFAGEFVPRSLFKVHANRMLRLFAVPLWVCYVILFPISCFFSVCSRLVLRMSGVKINKKDSDVAFSKVELDRFVQESLEEVGDEKDVDEEVRIFQNVLDFSNVKIRDCMVPRTEVVAVNLAETLETLRNLFVESGLSKIIVYDGNIDNVTGYIHSSEMFRNPDDWRQCVKTIPIVPETMPAHKLMQLFMQQKKTLAVVVDEFGGTSGVVSLEDLVEEIFGDIEDEHDNTSYVCKQVGAGEYVLSARLEIEKVNETFDLELPESDDYQTVGGLILNRYQNFPKLHEVVTIGPYHFKILRLTATKIELVRLKVTE